MITQPELVYVSAPQVLQATRSRDEALQTHRLHTMSRQARPALSRDVVDQEQEQETRLMAADAVVAFMDIAVSPARTIRERRSTMLVRR